MNRHRDQCKFYTGQHLIGPGLQVQRFSPLPSRWEHGSVQASMVQDELRVLQLHLKAGSRLAPMRLGGGAHFPFPQWHTSSSRATPTPTRLHLLIVPLPGPSLLKPHHSYKKIAALITLQGQSWPDHFSTRPHILAVLYHFSTCYLEASFYT